MDQLGLNVLPTHKTNDLAAMLEPWDIGNKDGATALILDHCDQAEEEANEDSSDYDAAGATALAYRGVPVNLWVAAQNMNAPKVTVKHASDANVYDILWHEKLIVTLEALSIIEERLSH